MQAYFSTYDNSCTWDFYELELVNTRNRKIEFMHANRSGSCRHRAFLAYLILVSTNTPTHYLLSRTHAWIESYILGKWRYIDLGGCPVETDFDPLDAGQLETQGMAGFSWSLQSFDPGSAH
jgi:hypothetical protein